MRLKTLIPKAEARRLAIQRKEDFTSGELERKTLIIIDRLTDTDDFNFANNIYCYISAGNGELETKALIDKMVACGKTVVIPKLNKISQELHRFYFKGWDELEKNESGYLEPKLAYKEDLSDIDLILVPATAISVNGHRVGNGGGYYDRLLKGAYAPKYSLAFEYQLFDNIEATHSDIRLDKIITERRIIDTRGNGKL